MVYFRSAALHSLPRAISIPRLSTSAKALAQIPNHRNNARISAFLKLVAPSARQHQTNASAHSTAAESRFVVALSIHPAMRTQQPSTIVLMALEQIPRFSRNAILARNATLTRMAMPTVVMPPATVPAKLRLALRSSQTNATSSPTASTSAMPTAPLCLTRLAVMLKSASLMLMAPCVCPRAACVL